MSVTKCKHPCNNHNQDTEYFMDSKVLLFPLQSQLLLSCLRKLLICFLSLDLLEFHVSAIIQHVFSLAKLQCF